MRYLTKSRFSIAVECPKRLDYCDDARYANAMAHDQFLMSLAEGGQQVGALAKCMFADGIEIKTREREEQVRQTEELLARDQVTLYEATFRVGKLFIRVDLLRKTGNRIEMYEVKAKGYDSQLAEESFVGKRGGLTSEMKPYLLDVAFQRHVLRKALPDYEIICHLVMPDKHAMCPQPGLNQMLRIKRQGKGVEVDIDPQLRDGNIAKKLLCVVPVDRYLDLIEMQPLEMGGWEFAFSEAIEQLEERLDREPFTPRLGNHCKACPFHADKQQIKNNLRDGRSECWRACTGKAMPQSGTVLDLRGFRKAEKLLAEGKHDLRDLEPEDVGLSESESKISASARQWLQCEEARGEVSEPYLMREPFNACLDELVYPLHFVDFETARPALPFHADFTPYQQLLFQFSHHRMDADGFCEHASEFLCDTGELPSVQVVRALKQAIGRDQGSVLHWWTHEQSVLKDVAVQLQTYSMQDVPDRDELLEFIHELVGKDGKPGRLFDLGRRVDDFVFLPGTKGRSSIKKVLPSLLDRMPSLQEKYAKGDYGLPGGMPSLNFCGKAWVQRDAAGHLLDPYQLLRSDVQFNELAELDAELDAHVANGGAAMIAYALLQSPELGEGERKNLRDQLLRYCELDTLAMVMVWEAIQELRMA